MGFLIGLIKKIFKLILYSAILVAVIVFIPNLPPYKKFTSIEIEPTRPLTGELALNGLLNNAQHFLEDKILGPECYQIYNDELYTSLATGEIVKISPGNLGTLVTKFGEPCTGLTEEHICGRPLGFVIDEENKAMYVADAYYGIWKVDIETYNKQLLVSPRVPINGKVPMIFNSVALAQNGDIYWTDSSTEYHLKDGFTSVMSGATGRLFHYNTAKNESRMLLDDLYFANGIVISPDNEFVVVAETIGFRLVKHYIKGPKKGNTEVFVAGLPGYPDNLRFLPDGSGVLISLYNVFDDDHPIILKSLASAPLVRKFVARTFHLIENIFDFLNKQYHHHIFEDIIYYIGSFGSAAGLHPGKSGLVQVDWNGKIIASYYNTDGSIHHISDAVVYKNNLYSGSPHQHYVAVVKAPPLLKKAFSTNKPAVEDTLNVQVKPTEQIKPKVEDKKDVPKQQQPKEVPKQEQPKEVPKQQQPKEVPKQQQTKEVPKQQQPKEAPKQQQPKEVPKQQQPKEVPKQQQTKEVPKQQQPKEAPKQQQPKEVPKQQQPKEVPKPQQPKEVPKQQQPKVVTKEPEVKVKVAATETESKSKVVAKEQIKEQEPEKNQKPTVTKSPNKKDTNTKPKEAEVKPKTESKESEQTKSVPKTVEPKSEEPQKKSEKVKVKENSGESAKKDKVDSKSKKNVPNNAAKSIPVEEEIPSDTAKPNKETLKVIKKSGPQEIPNHNL